MKKQICSAMLLFMLVGCYTPMNNSGVATTKPWLEISGKKQDFDGKQYDSCYQFKLHFWPQEAAQAINLKEACISGCCWRSDKEEVVIDFNKNFERDLATYGRARKYSPDKITLKINHSNWLNTTKVSVSPHGTISNNGLVKLSYKEYENPTRLAQLENAARQQAALAATQTAAYYQAQEALETKQATGAVQKAKKQVSTTLKQTTPSGEEIAKTLFQRHAGTKVDTFFYQMDKTYKKQGAVFLLSDRIFQPHATATHGVYTLYCQAKARTGLDIKQLRASTFSCGNWQVDINNQSIKPLDKRAQLVWDIK